MPPIAPISLEAAVVVLGVLLVLLEAILNDREKRHVGYAGIAGLGAVFVLSFFPQLPVGSAPYAQLYAADGMAIFFKRIALLTTMVVLVMSLEYRGVIRRYIFGAGNESGTGEFFALPVFPCAGLMWMASAQDFIAVFVSLELVTISFYVLVAYLRRSVASLEAGTKYLILGALSTGFLVYGMTWIFGVTGETSFARIAEMIPGMEEQAIPLLFGLALILIALGFKIAAAPFQLWVPDVYQGAPTPITAYLSVGSKAAGFVVLMRVLDTFMAADFLADKIVPLLAVLAVLTLLYGNLAAMPQDNVKRMLGYSSIGHAGYLLLALAATGASMSQATVSVYLAGYLLMTLLGFLVLVAVAGATGKDDLAAFHGLGKRSPFLAFALLVAMASLAGVPLTVGFVGKAMAFAVGIEMGLWIPVAAGVIAVVSGFYYYFKVIRAMYWMESPDSGAIRIEPLTKAVAVVLLAGILVFGVYPAPLLGLLK